MKGDITFKINKKIGLGLIGALSLFATADFVSLVDVKSAGGIVIEKETQTVGSIVLRIDNTNPADIYGGNWELITGDASLRLGNGNALSGAVTAGDNDPVVPVPLHNHTMNHNHASVNTSSDTHYHKVDYSTRASAENAPNDTGGWNYMFDDGTTRNTTSDTHAHSVDLPNYTGNTGNTGEAAAKLDVRGAFLTVNVWKRIG